MKSNNLPQILRMKLVKKLGRERLVKFFEFWLGRYMTPVNEYFIEMPDCKSEPDVIIWKMDHTPYMVVELKNYDVNGYMIEPTFKKIVNNLTKYNCYRLLVVSSENNLLIRKRIKHKDKSYTYEYSSILHTRELLSKYNIDIMILDRQDLPKELIESVEGWKE